MMSACGDRGLPHVSRRLEQASSAAGERSCASRRIGWARRGQEREPGKSDEIDALAVARAVVKDGVEQFPVAYPDEAVMEIPFAARSSRKFGRRADPHREPAAVHLLALCPELERSLKRGALNQARELDRVDRQLRKLPDGARVRVAREQVSQLRSLNRQTKQLHSELLELVKAHRPQLLAELGCGALTAAILIGHTAGFKQFRKPSSFGLQTGTAPIPCSSGKRTQHRLNRGGDRQLNHALHIIAITRAQRDPATKEYLARKAAEGKTTKGALRSLKRHLARRFYRLLAEAPADQQQASNGEPNISPSRRPRSSRRRSRRRPRRDERSIRPSRPRRRSRWSASARAPDRNPSGLFSGPLATSGELPPPRSHDQTRPTPPPGGPSSRPIDAFSADLSPCNTGPRPTAPPIHAQQHTPTADRSPRGNPQIADHP